MDVQLHRLLHTFHTDPPIVIIHHQLQIISRTDLLDANSQVDQRNDFTPVAEADSYYPITKVLWEPRKVRI